MDPKGLQAPVWEFQVQGDLVKDWIDFYNSAHAMRSWGHGVYPGETNSSMRHCVVSCMLASKFGGPKTIFAGAVNEYVGFIGIDVPTILSAVTGLGSKRYQQLGWGRLMGQVPFAFQIGDFVNNQRGVDCSKKIGCLNGGESLESSCIKCCQNQ